MWEVSKTGDDSIFAACFPSKPSTVQKIGVKYPPKQKAMGIIKNVKGVQNRKSDGRA